MLVILYSSSLLIDFLFYVNSMVEPYFYSIAKYKLPVVPGGLVATVSTHVGHSGSKFMTFVCGVILIGTVCFTPSLLTLKSPVSTSLQASLPQVLKCILEYSYYFNHKVAKEIREFMPLSYYEPHCHYYPSLSLINHLYVSPLSLKYDTQKQFPKASQVI